MKILVTGSKGFIGRNLVATLNTIDDIEVITYNRDNNIEDLKLLTKNCDFVYHLAGVMRNKDDAEFITGNISLIEELCNALKENNNKAPIVFSSSIHASSNVKSNFSVTKLDGEELFRKYSKEQNVEVYVYRISNLFGKWATPYYNNVTATWCYNIARNKEILIDQPEKKIPLCYIDDVILAFLDALYGKQEIKDGFCYIYPIYDVSLKDISDAIYSFKESRENLTLTNFASPFLKKLYSTYLSFLPENEFSYSLNSKTDIRGSFTEIFRTEDKGQVSVNLIKPGITKGNHWHHTKNEKFLVVHGNGIIRFRRIFNDEVITYNVSDDSLEIVDIPCGYTHNIENIGSDDMVVIMWANESFNPEKPDTLYEEV